MRLSMIARSLRLFASTTAAKQALKTSIKYAFRSSSTTSLAKNCDINITFYVNEIGSLTNDIKVKFEGPDGYRHEKFTDALLDGLAMEGAARLAVVAAMKCRGMYQEKLEEYANSYIGKLQNRLDVEFNDDDPFSIMYQLKNSDFHTWPDTIRVGTENTCYFDVFQERCNGLLECEVIDGYRLDLEVGSLRGDCDEWCAGGSYPPCSSELVPEAERYAADAYAGMAANVTDAAALERRFIDFINEVVSTPPSEEMCGGQYVY